MLTLVRKNVVPDDRFDDVTPRRLEYRPADPNGLSLSRIPAVDNGTICGAGLAAPYISSYALMNDSWSKKMAQLQVGGIVAAIVCGPLSYIFWPIWFGVIVGLTVAIVAGLAKRGPKKEEEPEIQDPRGSRAKVEG